MLTFYLAFTALLFLLNLIATLGTKPNSPREPNGSARFLMMACVIQSLMLALAASLLVKTWGVGL